MTGRAAAAGLVLMATVRLLCPAAGQTPFTLSVSQDVHQGEQHSNITLTWIFPVSAVRSTDSLIVDIMDVKHMRRIYNYNSETETELYPHELYRGRVLCDPQLFMKGRIECVFTDLRLNDTGTYQCVVMFDRYRSYKTCDLNVIETPDPPLQKNSKPAGRGRICLFAAFGLLLSALVTICYNKWCQRRHVLSVFLTQESEQVETSGV
ncbi:Programmed cell death 1 ligand 1 [Channa argus]|uniref:Programmed cell death 1 ligand 1 n=1 Tax=Channa argus TaxID=215402 RepID=A0A6G1Q5Z9_CHAAH|nr:Programmed cell death 1 ligand 1 [Channa argus]